MSVGIIIDIVVVAILVVFGIIGLAKGFVNTIISLFGNLASLAIGIIASKPAAKLIDSIFHLTEFLGGKIGGGIVSSLPVFDTVTAGTEALTGAQIKTQLATDGTTLLEKLLAPFIEDTATFTTTADLANSLGEKLAGVATIVVAVIVVFILVRIAVALLARLFNALSKNKAFSGLDRILGLILGLVKGALIIAVVLCIAYLLSPIPGLTETISGWIESTTVVKFFYGYITEFMTWAISSVDFNSLLQNLFGIGKAAEETAAETAETGTALIGMLN